MNKRTLITTLIMGLPALLIGLQTVDALENLYKILISKIPPTLILSLIIVSLYINLILLVHILMEPKKYQTSKFPKKDNKYLKKQQKQIIKHLTKIEKEIINYFLNLDSSYLEISEEDLRLNIFFTLCNEDKNILSFKNGFPDNIKVGIVFHTFYLKDWVNNYKRLLKK